MIYIAGMSIAVLFEFLLISKKNKSESDKILALWMFIMTVHLFLFYMMYTKEIFNYPFLLGISFPLPLLQGVFLYLYVGSATNQLPANKNFLAIHFLPAASMYVYLINFFALPSEQKIFIFNNNGVGYEQFSTISVYAIFLSGIVYVIWSSLLLKKHRKRILETFSYKEKIDLQWLQILTWGIGGIWLLVFFKYEPVIYAGVAVFVFLIGFFGIRQVRIFDTEKISLSDSENNTPEEEAKEKYAKSGLTEELSQKLYESLKAIMVNDAVYRKYNLSINDLAGRLKTHPNYLSQVINEREKKNFYDFVNHYRLEEFKLLLSNQKNRNYKLLSLAFECGFNSKSSFNRYFKKSTGKTPSEYYSELIQQ